MNAAQAKLVFVYGTLKRRGSNHRFLAGQTFIGEARTAAGYRLFNLGDYPGMVPLANDRDGVAGELWSVDAPCLAALDRFEGVAEGLYRRQSIPLRAPFSDRSVDAYLYALPLGNARDIGGDWPG